MVTGQGLENPREIVTIGFSDLEVDEIEGFLARTAPEEARRHERIDAVIEPEMTRASMSRSPTHLSDQRGGGSGGQWRRASSLGLIRPTGLPSGSSTIA